MANQEQREEYGERLVPEIKAVLPVGADVKFRTEDFGLHFSADWHDGSGLWNLQIFIEPNALFDYLMREDKADASKAKLLKLIGDTAKNVKPNQEPEWLYVTAEAVKVWA